MPNTNRIYEQYKVYIDTVFRIELRKQRDAGIYVSHEDEEDLHQIILQKVLKYIPRHNPKKSTIKTYLYTIVKSQLKWQMINLYGMDGRPKSKEAWYRSFAKLDDEGFDYDAPATRSVDDVVATMEQPMRQAVEMLLDGATHKQVQTRLGLSDEEWQDLLEDLKDFLQNGH